MNNSSTPTKIPSPEPTCCIPREHVLLLVEFAEVAQYDPDFRRLLPYARRLLFAERASR